ncbi:MAG: FAD-dependent oxidoreductase [Kiritimatiellae bacterium]|nr:FAD-dependent oxidoreductase [Kiritimatiellia bacterium]MDW8457982.1 FAD-dependent oxidoreductase [Verrucomicrobiota bacterium]
MKVLIVGGVAAGMSAAARLRRLDEQAQIVVLERSPYVSFANCGLPYYIGGIIRERSQLLLQTPASLKASLDLDVRTGHEVLAIDRKTRRVEVRETTSGRVYHESYDKLVLCPGALPLRPTLPGIDHPSILVLRNVPDTDAIKAKVDAGAKSAVIIGGGYIGVEMAESLKARGLEVDLVEMLPQVLPPIDPEMAWPLEEHMRAHGVRLHLGTAAAAFRDAGGGRVRTELHNGTTIESDFVMLSAGVRPDVELARAAGLELGPHGGIRVDEYLRTSDPDIYAAGDAVETPHRILGGSWLIPLAGPANRQGRVIADNLAGRPTKWIGAIGTSIVKVFDMAAGSAGANEKTLKRQKIPYRKVYIHPGHHAGYYPGAAPMHIKVLFAPETGKILGAQVVGFEGVDKRLDVLATAMQAGLTVFDLEHLELAYAPQFGSAKDPVNMVGFVASNVLRGDLDLWYPEEFPEKTGDGVILDVRSPSEYELGHVPGAINIPLPELRSRAVELPRTKPIYVYCKVGFRSYLASRALRQRGFHVRTLAGGFDTFRAWHRGSLDDSEMRRAEEHYVEPALSAKASAPPPPQALTGRVFSVDCSGLQCPGPVLKLNAAIQPLAPGDELDVTVSDPGFLADGPAWCRANGHELVEIRAEGPVVRARIRKGAPKASATSATAALPRKQAMVVFSDDLDKALAAFVIANGARAMGMEVTMFFTFWGLNILRKSQSPPLKKGALDRMFGLMMPRGVDELKLSKMNMLGLGTAMMKHVMAKKNVHSLSQLMEQARVSGVKLVACTMSMDVMGIRREELIDGVELGGVGMFIGESSESRATLFIG